MCKKKEVGNLCCYGTLKTQSLDLWIYKEVSDVYADEWGLAGGSSF